MIAYGRKPSEVQVTKESHGTYTVTVWEAEDGKPSRQAVAQKTTNIPTAEAAEAVAKPWRSALSRRGVVYYDGQDSARGECGQVL